NIGIIGSLTPPAEGGGYNATLNFLVNNTGYAFTSRPCVFPGGTAIADVCASGSLLGTAGASTPFNSFSNVDFTLLRAPEPGPLALFALGLTLAGIARRRRS